MTSNRAAGKAILASVSRAVPAILMQMFRPPARFAAALEAEFRAESELRAGAARQTAIILLLLIWVSYFGWDSFHAYRNADFRAGRDSLFAMRLAGTACIFATGVALMLWRGNRTASTLALSLCLGALYLLSLGMIAVTAFPFNYLFYFICLPLILLFMFGLFRVESRLVYELRLPAVHRDDRYRLSQEPARVPLQVAVLLQPRCARFPRLLLADRLCGLGRARAKRSPGLRPRAAAGGPQRPPRDVAPGHPRQDRRPGQGEGRASRSRRAAERRQVQVPRRCRP
jgi:hypothetical protein